MKNSNAHAIELLQGLEKIYKNHIEHVVVAQ